MALSNFNWPQKQLGANFQINSNTYNPFLETPSLGSGILNDYSNWTPKTDDLSLPTSTYMNYLKSKGFSEKLNDMTTLSNPFQSEDPLQKAAENISGVKEFNEKMEAQKAGMWNNLSSQLMKSSFDSPSFLAGSMIANDIAKTESAKFQSQVSGTGDEGAKPKEPGKFGKFLGRDEVGKAMDAAGNIATSISIATGGYNMFDGPEGGLTQAVDQGWNQASDVVSKFGPWGQLAGGIMKGVGMVNKLQNAFLGSKGTDNMTKTDALLNSPIGMMIPGLGLINALGGKNTQTITKDEESFSTVGASYAGTGNAVDEALTKSGKRYGAFSGKARHEADREIAEAKRQQAVMSGIADEASIRSNLYGSMTGINAAANSFAGAGGYQQANIRAARYGGILERAQRVANKPKPIIKLEIEQEIEIPEIFKEGGIIIHNKEPEWEFKSSPFVEEIIEDLESLKNGGSIEVTWEFKPAPDDFIDKLQKGGSFNVIPEGALHARKHSIELDDITKKGIPVISESEGGEIKQHAEIERDEIILRIEVTEQLEEAQKKYNSDDTSQSEKDKVAIEIGKLLTQEILYNTQDNTNLLNTI